ncbi:MAG: DUF1080 domain-containing protein [Kiritimatiellae bacterium]|nr:DUF1080 domain-containing protein [Kiritimatiellia bacterium]
MDIKIISAVCAAAFAGCAAVTGSTERCAFKPLFDGKSLDGWTVKGGSAGFSVEDGAIVGRGVPDTYGNTFLCTEKEYANFILKLEYKIDSGNSGVQFRSAERPAAEYRHGNEIYGYQAEITLDGENASRIYDEARRGHKYGIVWLDASTPAERLETAKASFRPGDWNELEIQCVGPSVKTWLNGNKVADIFDDASERGFIGLQVHCGPECVVRWRNVRIRELDDSPAWKKFFVKGAGGEPKVEGAHYILPECWTFEKNDSDGEYLKGFHPAGIEEDGLVISDLDYGNFVARVSYNINGGNSALYFRSAEENIPWVLKGFQNEIAGNSRDSALWHTQGETTPGRGWIAWNDELVEKVRKPGGWNTITTIAVADRIVDRINGFETFDIVDPECEKTGKLGLQLHGGIEVVMKFKDWEMMPVPDWMLPYIAR